MSSKESEFLVEIPKRDLSTDEHSISKTSGLRKAGKIVSTLFLSVLAFSLIGACWRNSSAISTQLWWWFFPWPHPKPDEPVNSEIRWDRSCGDKTNSTLFECGTIYTPPN